VRFADGAWWCTLCGTRLDGVSAATVPVEHIDRSTEPPFRIVEIDGKEIHRCPLDPAERD
jgi:hypothetical protein